MKDENKSINNKIFELLESRGILQRELSDMTGISTSAISDWKHKGTIPSAANVQKICEALGVEPEQILGRTNNNTDKGYVVSKDDDLYEFVNLYKQMDGNMKKRILAYAIAMMKMEK